MQLLYVGSSLSRSTSHAPAKLTKRPGGFAAETTRHLLARLDASSPQLVVMNEASNPQHVLNAR
jgi:hypothetical protein